MQTTVTQPELIKDQEVLEFRSQPQSKEFVAIVNDKGVRKKVVFNIQDMLDTISASNKTVIKAWYKNLAVLAINSLNSGIGVTIAGTDIVGEVFDDE